jgi:hypothetical protein
MYLFMMPRLDQLSAAEVTTLTINDTECCDPEYVILVPAQQIESLLGSPVPEFLCPGPRLGGTVADTCGSTVNVSQSTSEQSQLRAALVQALEELRRLKVFGLCSDF